MSIIGNSFVIILMMVILLVAAGVISNSVSSNNKTMSQVSVLIEEARKLHRLNKKESGAAAISNDAKVVGILYSAKLIANPKQIEEHTGHEINRLINQAETSVRRRIKQSDRRNQSLRRTSIARRNR